MREGEDGFLTSYREWAEVVLRHSLDSDLEWEQDYGPILNGWRCSTFEAKRATLARTVRKIALWPDGYAITPTTDPEEVSAKHGFGCVNVEDDLSDFGFGVFCSDGAGSC